MGFGPEIIEPLIDFCWPSCADWDSVPRPLRQNLGFGACTPKPGFLMLSRFYISTWTKLNRKWNENAGVDGAMGSLWKKCVAKLWQFLYDRKPGDLKYNVSTMIQCLFEHGHCHGHVDSFPAQTFVWCLLCFWATLRIHAMSALQNRSEKSAVPEAVRAHRLYHQFGSYYCSLSLHDSSCLLAYSTSSDLLVSRISCVSTSFGFILSVHIVSADVSAGRMATQWSSFQLKVQLKFGAPKPSLMLMALSVVRSC